MSTRPATSAAAASAAARRIVAATVYRLIASATGNSAPRAGHSARTAAARIVQTNTGPGQTRRSGSAAAITTATSKLAAGDSAAGCAVWPNEKYARDAAPAKMAQPMSKAQERSGRVPGPRLAARKTLLHPRSSGVAPPQPPGGQAGQGDRVPAQDRESGPRAQRMRDQRLAPQCPAGAGGQIARYPGDAVREVGRDDRRDQEQRGE